MDQLLRQLQQQATVLEDVHRELHDDNRLMETQVKELSIKLDNMTSSLVTGITSTANPNCILLTSVSFSAVSNESKNTSLPVESNF